MLMFATPARGLRRWKYHSARYQNPKGIVWNNKAKRLEFTDGEPVGCRTIEQARAERAAARS